MNRPTSLGPNLEGYIDRVRVGLSAIWTGYHMGDVQDGEGALRGIKVGTCLHSAPRSYFEGLSTNGPTLRGMVNVGLDSPVGD